MDAVSSTSEIINNDNSHFEEFKIHDSNENSPVNIHTTRANNFEHRRKFNVTQAPISRPPSAYGKSTKVQKINPSVPRKRQKWNDRFHIQSDKRRNIEQTNIHPVKHHHKQVKHKTTYSKMHLNRIKHKKRSSSSIIPPVDIISGKREWGKRNKKRAKWSIMKKNSDNNKANNIIKPLKSKRAKWNTHVTQHQNITNIRNNKNASRTRVLQLSPTSNIINANKSSTRSTDINIQNVLKNIIKNDNECILQQNKLADTINDNISTKHNPQNIEEKEEKEEKEEITKKINKEDKQESMIKNEKEIPKKQNMKLLPITKRNKEMNQQKKQYLEPLDKVADIILDDLIDQICGELDTFCCELIDTLIECETNV